MAKSKVDYWLTKDGLTLLEGWARDGLTDIEIANKIGITARTLYRWKEKECQICQSLKKGKEIVDTEVENALLKRTLGYKKKLKKQKVTKDGDVVDIFEEVYYPPDTTAIIYWLNNRKPDRWRNKRDNSSEDKNEEDGVIIVNDLPKF